MGGSCLSAMLFVLFANAYIVLSVRPYIFENLEAVLPALGHGLEMLASAGSADCGEPTPTKKPVPSVDAWLKEAKAAESAGKIGMYLLHNGTVRGTARAAARDGKTDLPPIRGMSFSYDAKKVEAA